VVDSVVVDEDGELRAGSTPTQPKFGLELGSLNSVDVDGVRQLHDGSVKHGGHRFKGDAVGPREQLARRHALILDVFVEGVADEGRLAAHHLLVDQAILLVLVLHDQVARFLAQFVVLGRSA
jgi:hypothetical protein